jgi:hypothetical protein
MLLINKFPTARKERQGQPCQLGLSADAVRKVLETDTNDEPPGEPAADGEIKALKLHAQLVDGIADLGMDRRLTVAAIASDKSLDAIDPASDTGPGGGGLPQRVGPSSGAD